MTIDTTPLNHADGFKALCAEAAGRVKELSADEVEAKLRGAEKVHLIDVRDADEFAAGHLEGAVHLSKGWIEAKIHTVVHDPSDEVILYCGSGMRSVLAADNLLKMGYRNVSSMSGGIKGWVKSGRSLD